MTKVKGDEPEGSEIANSSFPFMTQEASRIVRKLCSECRISQGENLFSVGDRADAVYFLLKGQLAVKKETGLGRNTQVIALLQPQVPVGEAALAVGDTRKTTVSATEDSVLLKLESDRFDTFRADHPEVAVSLLQYLLRASSLRLEKCSERLSHIL